MHLPAMPGARHQSVTRSGRLAFGDIPLASVCQTMPTG